MMWRWLTGRRDAPEIDDEDEDDIILEQENPELFISDLEFYTPDAGKFFEATGALAALSLAGDIYLFLPDGKLHKVEIASTKFKVGKGSQVTSIK